MLQIKDLSVEVEGKHILHDINISVGAGLSACRYLWATDRACRSVETGG